MTANEKIMKDVPPEIMANVSYNLAEYLVRAERYKTALTAVTQKLADDVNAIHTTGFDLGGAAGHQHPGIGPGLAGAADRLLGLPHGLGRHGAGVVGAGGQVACVAAERRATEAVRKFTLWQALYNPKVLLLALNFLPKTTPDESGTPRRLILNAADPAYARDGRSVAYANAATKTIWVSDATGQNARALTTAPATGEAAFYGPKIDFISKDSLGREWQVATIQLDMNMPERFDLTCTNEKGEKERIVMIHAAIMGSIERFLSISMTMPSRMSRFSSGTSSMSAAAAIAFAADSGITPTRGHSISRCRRSPLRRRRSRSRRPTRAPQRATRPPPSQRSKIHFSTRLFSA